MKVKLIGKGNSTLEIVIALAVLTLTMSAVIVVLFGNQTIVADAQMTHDALLETREKLQDKRDITTTHLTQCKRQVSARTNFAPTPIRPQTIEFTTLFADIPTMFALGRDCDVAVPASLWINPQRLSQSTFSGKPTAIDVLDGVAYVGGTTAPYLFIAAGGNFVSFANSFNAEVKINALDAIEGYVFAAVASTSGQLRIFDVTDKNNPKLVATKTLSSCVTGSFPQGWRVYYFGNRLYVTTRETAGPEFHIFDVTDPENPFEYGTGSCKGYALQSTVNNLVVREQKIGGISKLFAYLATQKSDKELRVLDVTNPENILEVAAASKDLLGVHNGESVFAIGNTLYFGRQSTPTGPELYLFNIENPLLGAPELASYDIGATVGSIHVVGGLAYLGTSRANEELQIWNVRESPAARVSSYALTNILGGGMDWDSDKLYATSQGSEGLHIIYDPF